MKVNRRPNKDGIKRSWKSRRSNTFNIFLSKHSIKYFFLRANRSEDFQNPELGSVKLAQIDNCLHKNTRIPRKIVMVDISNYYTCCYIKIKINVILKTTLLNREEELKIFKTGLRVIAINP